MAEVYPRIKEGKGKGRKIQQAMGLHRDVQTRLRLEAVLGAHRADARLRIIESKPGYDRTGGHSTITTESGRVDHYVILDDTRGLDAALSIEYGRKPKVVEVIDPETGTKTLVKKGGMQGTFLLRDSMKFLPGSGGPNPGSEAELDE